MRKKYPFVKQDDLKDCAIASLLMIIRFYKGNMSKEKLRQMSRTTKSGTTAYHLIETARAIGFRSEGIRIKIEEVEHNNIILPCIAHVTIDKIYQHYIVIYEINFNKKTLIIADPAKGIKKITWKEFKTIYNDILITLYPKRKIPICYKEKSFYKYITELLMQNKKKLLIIVILSLLITILSICSSFYFQISLQNINHHNLISRLMILFIFFELLKNIFLWIRNQIFIFLNQKITKELFTDVLKKIILLPYHYYRNRTSGELITRINDLNIIKQTVSEIILTFFIDIILTFVAAVILYHVNSLLFIFSLAFLIVYIIIFYIVKPVMYKRLNELKNSHTNMNSYIVENLTGFETVKGLGIEKHVISQLNDLLQIHLQKQKKLEVLSNLEQTIISFLNGMISIILIFFGILFIHYKKIELSSFITFLFLFHYFIEPVKNILNLIKNMEEAKISYQRISEIMNDEKKNINYENICFSNLIIQEHPTLYNNQTLLKNQTLSIQNKEKIAIIGPSGSGKSTLLKLLKNYYPINRVMVNNRNLNEISRMDINQNVLYISQNEILFTDTLYNNIVLNETVEQERFFQVIKDCYIEEIIKNNSLNYYMLIEENGFNISGGEKQRIILARALLKNFNYLLIDEGLSQVDVSLERKILKNILHHYSEKSIVFVTHRTDNIDLFERVIQMKHGKVIEDLKRNQGKEVL